MQDVTEKSQQEESGLSGRVTRQDRQARVGILRNPAAPPRPPMRRAQLMGRWLNLRSSRRPPGAEVAAAAESVVTTFTADQPGPRPVVPVRRAADGSVQSIDIAGLMASVDGHGIKTPVRAGYADSMRPDAEAAGSPPPEPRKPAILTAAAWIDEDETPGGEVPEGDALSAALREPPAPVVPVKPQRRFAGRTLRIVSLGLVIAAAALILLPAWGALLPA